MKIHPLKITWDEKKEYWISKNKKGYNLTIGIRKAFLENLCSTIKFNKQSVYRLKKIKPKININLLQSLIYDKTNDYINFIKDFPLPQDLKDLLSVKYGNECCICLENINHKCTCNNTGLAILKPCLHYLCVCCFAKYTKDKYIFESKKINNCRLIGTIDITRDWNNEIRCPICRVFITRSFDSSEVDIKILEQTDLINDYLNNIILIYNKI